MKGGFMNLTLIILLIVMVIFLLFFLYIEPILMKHKVKNDNEYGSARFSTNNEIKENFKKENVNHIKEAGFPVSYSKDLKNIYFDRETPHYVYLGSTGSGKTVTVVLNECTFISAAAEKRSVFITDPKGEIYQNTSKMFKDRNYNILTIDFRNPELSNKINILDPIINEYDEYIANDKSVVTFTNLIIAHQNDNKRLEKLLKNEKIKGKNREFINDRIKYNNISIENYSVIKNNLNNNAMSHYAETNRLISSLATM